MASPQGSGPTHPWVVLQVVTQKSRLRLPRAFLYLSCDFWQLPFSHSGEERKRERSPCELSNAPTLWCPVLSDMSPSGCRGPEMLLICVPGKDRRTRYGSPWSEGMGVGITSLLILIQVGPIFWRPGRKQKSSWSLYIKNITTENKNGAIRGKTEEDRGSILMFPSLISLCAPFLISVFLSLLASQTPSVGPPSRTVSSRTASYFSDSEVHSNMPYFLRAILSDR